MDAKQLTLIVGSITILLNLAFVLTGVTSTLSCTMSSAIESAYAAIVLRTE